MGVACGRIAQPSHSTTIPSKPADEAASGFVETAEASPSPRFEEMVELPCKGYNRLAKARRYGRWWMLKGLKAGHGGRQLYRTLLRKEFDILVSLQHPGIVAASGFEEVDGLGPCIVMEWVDGMTLSEWLAADERTAGQRLAVVGELLDALEYIHGRQLVHRDLKPSNILLTRNGHHVKLIDFGLADTDSHHILKQPAGTRDYVSPEQATTRQTDQRNDIYSLGCVMDALALGRRYEGIVGRCKAPLPQRYASVQEVRRALERQASGASRRRNLALAALAPIAILAATLLYMGNRKAQQPMPIPQQSQPTAPTPKDTAASGAFATSIHAESPAPSASSGIAKQEALGKHIADGKKAIDRLWEGLGVEAAADTIAKGERFYRFVSESNALINGYPSLLSDPLTEGDRTAIVQALSAYAAKRYVGSTLRELQAAPR